MRVCVKNFSEFLKVVKNENSWINYRLEAIYHEIKDSDVNIKKVISVLCISPNYKTLISISHFTKSIINGFSISNATFKVITYNYMEIAKVTCNVSVAKKTIEMINQYSRCR